MLDVVEICLIIGALHPSPRNSCIVLYYSAYIPSALELGPLHTRDICWTGPIGGLNCMLIRTLV